MLWLDETSAEEYLRDCGAIGPAEQVRIEPLSGGVSNQVLYIATSGGRRADFVLKQARPQLRTPQPWFSSIERIWREVEVLRVCQEVLAGDHAPSSKRIQTPRILFEDRTCYTFAMTAAPREHVVWKSQLLAGRADASIAAACGHLLATLHRQTWNSPDVARRVGDGQLFEELRLDPYYRTVARIDPEANELMQGLISSVLDHPCSLVHADFSPKNLLVYPDGLMMVDFETGHYGDPAFDLGFFLSHLVLKAVHHAPDHEPYLSLTEHFWDNYLSTLSAACGLAGPSTEPSIETVPLIARGILNFAGCAWARIDGKSQVEYLVDSPRRGDVRQLCRDLLREPVANWREALGRIRQIL